MVTVLSFCESSVLFSKLESAALHRSGSGLIIKECPMNCTTVQLLEFVVFFVYRYESKIGCIDDNRITYLAALTKSLFAIKNSVSFIVDYK